MFLLTLLSAKVQGVLEVTPASLLVSSKGSLQRDSQDGELHSISSGAIDEVLLSCMEVLPSGLTRRPREEVVWTQNKNTINTDGSKYRNQRRKKRLLIKDLVPEDSGVYECATISNLVERGRAELWVAPKVMSAPDQQILHLETDGVITCSVSGGTRNLHWTKDGQFVAFSNSTGTSTANTRYTVLRTGSLRISGVTEQDVGVYNCTVSNPAGSESALIGVETQQIMQSPLRINDGCMLQNETATVFADNSRAGGDTEGSGQLMFTQTPPECVRTMETFDLTLKCSADGFPKPSITWIRQNSPMDSSRHTQLPDGSLKISAVQYSDRGLYTCQASNTHETKSVDIRLKVLTTNSVCGYPWGEDQDRVKRIVEGEASHIRNWPWQVIIEYSAAVTNSIFFEQSEERFCGGALIGPNWVVTAAHCLYSTTLGWLSPHHLLLRAGVFNRSDTSEIYQQALEVDHIAVHPQFNIGVSSPSHDIALIRLSYPVKLTSHVGFVCLPASRSSDPPVGTLCTVTGWGHKMNDAGVSPDLLHSAQVPVVSRSQCTSGQAYKRGDVNVNEICAGWRDGGADACQNDSGGPLSCTIPESGRWVLNGVVNRGIGCGDPHKYGIYAKVTHHIGWINSVIS